MRTFEQWPQTGRCRRGAREAAAADLRGGGGDEMLAWPRAPVDGTQRTGATSTMCTCAAPACAPTVCPDIGRSVGCGSCVHWLLRCCRWWRPGVRGGSGCPVCAACRRARAGQPDREHTGRASADRWPDRMWPARPDDGRRTAGGDAGATAAGRAPFGRAISQCGQRYNRHKNSCRCAFYDIKSKTIKIITDYDFVHTARMGVYGCASHFRTAHCSVCDHTHSEKYMLHL